MSRVSPEELTTLREWSSLEARLSDDLIDAQTEITRLRAALADALEGMEDMIGYVTPYFIDKWDHVGYINRARVALGLPELAPAD